MGFYEELSKYYDIVFEKNNATVEFLLENLKKHQKVIDLACGSGTYSIELAKNKMKVLGIDLDLDMINLAKKKSDKLENVNFVCENMMNLKNIAKGEYSSIFCIGNSLVHITDRETIKALFKDIHDVLEPQGELIVQIINYDRIIKYNVDHLPTIKRDKEALEFIRKYDYNKEEDLVYFNSELIIGNEENHRYENTVTLLPLRKDELELMLLDIGFSHMEFYGGFNKIPYNDKAYATVVRARKI
ncbi:class I SAM-dependent methyltransferase [Clostridium amazonitimonense]|uniref:class I SAM-dependent methyltransferase n=1 Tax=Clostridium amazonitimonense TaxID=1499689 RepID=UPI0005099383|nr:class I SAM-dependent methyltransferase [Clostridium amazonitimonense]